MLIINNLTIIKKDGNRPLIKNFSFSLGENDKLAIIGEEGDGKSSFLKWIFDSSLLDSYCTYSGTLSCDKKLGYLSQTLEDGYEEKTVEDFFLTSNPKGPKDLALYNDFNRIQECLNKVSLDSSLLFSERMLGSFSGGEKVKVRMAKLLFEEPDILLLDEPTNDLDLDALVWMEKFIKDSKVPIIYVSHDETLLSKTANRILHLEQIEEKKECKATCVSLDYLSYVESRLHLIDKQNLLCKEEGKAFQAKKSRFLHVYDSVRYQQANLPNAGSDTAGRLMAKKMKALLSQRSRLSKEEENLTPKADVEEAINMKFGLEHPLKEGDAVLNLKLKELKAGEKVLSSNVFLHVFGQDKIVIIGPNGSGKTTLIKIIFQMLKERKDLKIGYMPQNYEDEMDYDASALDFISPSQRKDDLSKANEFLGAFRFSPEEMLSSLKYLSSGQKGKLFLAKFILEGDNFLLLDEPTRNLSPLSNPVIRRALNEYKGGFISVSHDRLFIKKTAQRVFKLERDGLLEIGKDSLDF
jgi:ATP-binding cassette subfamily F protein 3